MKIAKSIVRLEKDSRGVAAIEAAVALPVLLMLLLGVFELSTVMRYQAGYHDAVSSGARYATLSPTPTEQQVIDRVISTSSVPMTNANVTVTVGTSASGRDYYDVAVVGTYTINVPFASVPAITLTSSKRAYVD